MMTYEKPFTKNSAPAHNPIPAHPPLADIEKLAPATPTALAKELLSDLMTLGCLALVLSIAATALGAVGLF